MVEELKKSLAPLKREVVSHALFGALKTPEDVRVFMEHHGFAVWDFMNLLKSLQANLTCVAVPWVPTDDTGCRRFINEIVLAEESDDHPKGGYSSHFELYREAMRQCGANTGSIDLFLQKIRFGEPPEKALLSSGAPSGAVDFVNWTLGVTRLPAHRIAAAFTFGREELIPDLFRTLMSELAARFSGRFDLFVSYLGRHVDLDENTHSPLAFRMLGSLCGSDPLKWAEALETAREALVFRKRLWDGIVDYLPARGQRKVVSVGAES